MKRSNSSFRDSSGFIFFEGENLFRQVNPEYFDIYKKLKDEKIFESLWGKNLMVRHQEIKSTPEAIIIKPEKIPFISYPYEWSFSQLKDAALLTLVLQKELLKSDFSLKDASAYNVQFIGYRPIFIDTLSIEPYVEGPWVAFGQFCKHFLYPLMLMAKHDLRLNNLLKLWIDGIPVDIVDRLLPFSKYFSLNYWLYVKCLNNAQKKAENSHKKISITISKSQLLKVIDGLICTVNNLHPKKCKTEWGEYYTITNYSEASFDAKTKIVDSFIKKVNPNSVWDLGANNGHFSRLASRKGINTLAFDIDPIAVEKNYYASKTQKEENILPLLLDLTNPSPNIGWDNLERVSIEQRGKADLCLSLALIHHLAIGNNVPFENIASYFSKLCNSLVVEFIPKEDSKVQELLLNRKDIFTNYTIENFLRQFERYFSIEETVQVSDSLRTIFLMKTKNA